MDLLAKLFDALSKTVGTPAVILVAVSFIVLQFGDVTLKVLKEKPLAAVPAIGIFVLGVLVGFVRVLNVRFEVRAGRGFLEGLLAGIPSGIVAGALYRRNVLPNDTPEAAFARALLITILVGGFYGLALSLCHPRAKFNWSERVAAIAVLVTAIMLPIAIVIGYYAEHWLPGRYVTYSEVAAAAAVFVSVKAIFPLTAVRSGWRRFPFTQLAMSAALSALIAWALPKVLNPERLTFVGARTVPLTVMILATLVVCMSAVYFVTTTDNVITRWFGATRRPHRAVR